MDSAVPIIPSPSTGWGRLAVTHGDLSPKAETARPKPSLREDDAAQLKERLLKMIVANEQTRKAAATEARNAR